MTLRRELPAGLAVGVIAGLIAAIAIPRTQAGGQASATPQLGPAGVVRTAPARHRPGGEAFIELRLRGVPRIEARIRDPRGGPDWAVRVFHANRVVPPEAQRHGVDPVIGHPLCAQLGRIYRGRFGWLDASGTFRPVAIDYRGAPSTCGSRKPDLGGEPYFDVVIPITDPRRSEAHAKQLVAWGLAGSGATRVQLRIGSVAVTAPHSAHGAFLAIGPPQLRSDQVTGTISYRGGRSIHLPNLPTGGMFSPSHSKLVLSGRAPDPNGGLPYALLSNDTCTQWGSRILDDDRFGTVDYELGTFEELRRAGGAACGRSATDDKKLFARYPVLLGYGEAGDEPGSVPDPGRVARRTQRGTTIFTGRVAPNVVAVTLETPRDVRTLTPAGPAHAIIAVYDGSFPTGSVKVIAQFKDGHRKTQTLPNLGF
jgi:hypothetical protein